VRGVVSAVTEIRDEIAVTRRRVDELIRDLTVSKPERPGSTRPTFERRSLVPFADVFVRDGDVTFRIELPGIDEKDVSVTSDDGYLVIRGQRRKDDKTADANYLRVECAYGPFDRRFHLPAGVDERNVVTEYRNGILDVTLPMVVKR
jgi:HSP20 family molecular chaperone IbpA